MITMSTATEGAIAKFGGQIGPGKSNLGQMDVLRTPGFFRNVFGTASTAIGRLTRSPIAQRLAERLDRFERLGRFVRVETPIH